MKVKEIVNLFKEDGNNWFEVYYNDGESFYWDNETCYSDYWENEKFTNEDYERIKDADVVKIFTSGGEGGDGEFSTLILFIERV